MQVAETIKYHESSHKPQTRESYHEDYKPKDARPKFNGDSNIHGDTFLHHFAQNQKRLLFIMFCIIMIGTAMHKGRAWQRERERRGVNFSF